MDHLQYEIYKSNTRHALHYIKSPHGCIKLLFKTSVFIFLLFLLPLSAQASNNIWRGPLNITNNFPTTLIFYNYTPEDVTTLNKKEYLTRFGVTESNTVIKDKKNNSEAIIDLELTRFQVNLFTGITDNFEAGVELPFLYYHKGFMDLPTEWVEDRLGKGSRVRKQLQRNDIRLFLSKDGTVIYDINNSIFGIGDITLKMKYALLREDGSIPDLSLKFDLNLPTANQDRVFGSGQIDLGPTIIIHKGFNQWHLQLHAGYFLLNDMDIASLNIATSNFFHGIFAVEYVRDNISWIFQLAGNSNPFKEFELEDINSGGEAISVGFKYPFKDKWLLQFAMTENISSVAYPDFSIDFIVEYRFDMN